MNWIAHRFRTLFFYFVTQDYDYYDRYEDSRDLFDRRYSGMSSSGMRGIEQMGFVQPLSLFKSLSICENFIFKLNLDIYIDK